MQKFTLDKIENLADVFISLMGEKTDDIRRIEAFMKDSKLNQLLYASDIEIILKYDGFFADEVVDAVYALLPTEFELTNKNWIMTPQTFRKLNAAKISCAASRVVNIDFPKAMRIYYAAYQSKIEDVIRAVRLAKGEQTGGYTPVKEETKTVAPESNPFLTKSKPRSKKTSAMPTVVVERQREVAHNQDRKPVEKKKELTPREQKRAIRLAEMQAKKERLEKEREERRARKEELEREHQKKVEQNKAKREEIKKRKQQAREQKALVDEVIREQKMISAEEKMKNAEKDRARQKKQKKDLKLAKEEQQRRKEEREALKEQKKAENLLLVQEEQERNEKEKKKIKRKKQAERRALAKENPKLAEKREKNRTRMQKKRKEHPESRKSYYTKYEDLSEEEREKKRQENRERNRRYREKNRLKIRQARNEHRARLKEENPELLKEMDRLNNQRANRTEIGHRYFQNHKEEINRKARENPMRKIYNQRYDEKQRKKKEEEKDNLLFQRLLAERLNKKD